MSKGTKHWAVENKHFSLPVTQFVPLEGKPVLPSFYDFSRNNLYLGEVRWDEVKSLSRVQLCDPVDCNLLDFSVHGILQARILEWIAISFSRGSSRPRDRTQVSHVGGRRFNLWATREALTYT